MKLEVEIWLLVWCIKIYTEYIQIQSRVIGAKFSILISLPLKEQLGLKWRIHLVFVVWNNLKYEQGIVKHGAWHRVGTQ